MGPTVANTQQKERYSWDFVLLGANHDAVFAGESLGFDAGSSMTFAPGTWGVALMSMSVGRTRTRIGRFATRCSRRV